MKWPPCFALLIFFLAAATGVEHGTPIHDATLYVAPGANSEKLTRVDRGRDMVILERTNVDNKTWFKVFATIVQGENSREITGWLSARTVITVSAPNADQIIFGEAVDSEQQAEQRGGRKGAAQDAMRLYYRMAEFFPNSPLAGEALWRSADIRWQLDKADLIVRPSWREQVPDARAPIQDSFMRDIIKKFPNTKWADLAAYDMIDNKLCGEWKGLTQCPEKEADPYELYAKEHPRSPKAAEALYNAAWRQAALVDIYRINGEAAKSSNAGKRATALAQQVVNQYPEGDWKPRALDLAYKLEHGVPLYGNVAE